MDIEDKCEYPKCDKESTVGVIGTNDGDVYHYHYCTQHKMHGNPDDIEPETKIAKNPLAEMFPLKRVKIRSLNKGIELAISKKGREIHFWPTTLRWINYKNGSRGMGADSACLELGL